ncbi:MAG: asparagine synthase (glutamine-hydrolyzing) [bacterium]
MCGISGILDFSDKGIKPKEIRAMMNRIVHRGPDDSGDLLVDIGKGEFQAGHKAKDDQTDIRLAFGHNRLSIIDLSEAGRQPMCNEDRSVWLTYNGEIYNYKELAAELKNLGHSFHSQTDSEVIIHAYEQWGRECLLRFNGMWAFGLWDQNRRLLFMARDRFGIKPFYYFQAENRLIFSSEIKAVQALIKLEPDYQTLFRYLTTGYEDGLEETFFKSVKQLPPGNCMWITYPENRLQIKKYWQFPLHAPASELTAGQREEKFRYLLEDSVKLRLRSDVPVGTCLSGGLDSSSIFLFASRHYTDGRMHAFTSYFPEGGRYDETRYANLMVQACQGIGHQVQPDSRQLLEKLEQIIWHIENPPESPGVFPQWHVLELAQKKVKVVLDGQGGDELLAGYNYYYNFYVRDFINQFFRRLGQLPQLFAALKFLDKPQIRDILITELVPNSLVNLKERYFPFNDWFTFMARGFREQFEGQGLPPTEPVGSKLSTKLFYDTTRDRLPKLLKYEDKISMAFSLETRVPFMDYRLVEFIFSLPDSSKIEDGWTKIMLRRAMDSQLPREITWRKDKQGFPTPFTGWARTCLKEPVRELFNSSSFKERGLFDVKEVNRHLTDLCAGREVPYWYIWSGLVTELWFRKYGL